MSNGSFVERAAQTIAAEDAPTAQGHPVSTLEAMVLMLAAAYLLSPWRWLDFAAFSLGAGALWFSRRAAPPVAVTSQRRLRVEAAVLGATAAFAALMIAVDPNGTFAWNRLALTGAIYLPFAFLQQYMAQRYIAGRLARRLTGGRTLPTAALGGLLFGLCHLSLPGLTLPTILTGFFWAWAWLSGARLFPLATSHALLGACYFIVVLGRDPFRTLGVG